MKIGVCYFIKINNYCLIEYIYFFKLGTTSRTELLIDSRIAKNDLFKGRGHSGPAWQ